VRIAIPVAGGHLCPHFGQCEQYALVNVDPQKKEVVSMDMLTPPPHEPGVLPRWLQEQGATVVIAGGMGRRARELFAGNGIAVVVGAPAEAPQQLAAAYLNGTLQTGENTCDH
jgi:predicted Fe-Mo cluster-binding NifX family protein